jgi:hypothetical protein
MGGGRVACCGSVDARGSDDHGSCEPLRLERQGGDPLVPGRASAFLRRVPSETSLVSAEETAFNFPLLSIVHFLYSYLSILQFCDIFLSQFPRDWTLLQLPHQHEE